MFAQEFDEFRDAAFFIGAEVKMDVPAEVIFAEGEVEFGAGVDDVVECVEAEGFGFAKLAFEVGVFDAAAEDPHGVNEGEAGKVEPGDPEVPNLLGWICTDEFERDVADEEDIWKFADAFVAGEGEEFRFKAALFEKDAEKVDAGERGGVTMDLANLFEGIGVGEENAFYFAKAGDGDAVENVVLVVEKDFGDAEQSGVELAGAEELGEFGGGDKLDFIFEAARERDCVEVRDRADPIRR